ncbi:hypothetical protein DL89DRAFT_81534 [Linderina pennispora]|uniref:Autophagy-related protein 17 n=1 Tax=Linderina pennispora TaxID=61395 RepID=A0A1Y1WHU2_9FUNG|nr:uncharacterized protein DL89DRAFT_81534 [Linderina pennispora]ORX72694.1 hypothetical protein DL89DRAFT_81534 [Linderina pennispora]
MSAVLELLRNREVVGKEFRSPFDSAPGGTRKHTLHDHIDQAAVDALQGKTEECLNHLAEIAAADVALARAVLDEVQAIEVPVPDDISVTWGGLREAAALLAETLGSVADIRQDTEMISHHCAQLQDSVKDLESEGGVLSLDDYKVLLRDTDEIPLIIAELQDALVGIRRRADETNVRSLQCAAFFADYVEQSQAIGGISQAIGGFLSRSESSQGEFQRLLTEVEVFQDEMWNLITWYRNFHGAYDALVGEVHRRRQAQAQQHAVVEDVRARLDVMHLEEVDRRSEFVDKFGPFLPSDLCPFIQDPPPRFIVDEIGDVERLASVQSYDTQ